MPDLIDYSKAGDRFVVPADLNRRVASAVIDVSAVSVLVLALFMRLGPMPWEQMPAWLWKLAAALLAAAAVIELLTGVTPGKATTGFRVQSLGGGKTPIWRYVLRGVIRLAPVGVFLLSFAPRDGTTAFILLAAAVSWAIAYIPMCYISLFRTGRTTFDIIAGTTTGR